MKAVLAMITTVTLLSAPGAARGDGIDRSLYRDVPARWQAIISTIPVNRDDAIGDELRRKYAGQRLYGEYMVYYGADGDIDAIEVVKSIAGCDELVEAWIRENQKQYRPPERQRVRRLSKVEVSFPPTGERQESAKKDKPVPAPPGSRPKTVPPHMFDTQAIERETPHLPEAVREKHAGQNLVVMYYVTLGTDGHVTAVDPINPIADVDAAIIETLKRWRFKPQPLALRTMLRFEFYIPPAPH